MEPEDLSSAANCRDVTPYVLIRCRQDDPTKPSDLMSPASGNRPIKRRRVHPSPGLGMRPGMKSESIQVFKIEQALFFTASSIRHEQGDTDSDLGETI
jgi:hypothetical protein